MKIEELKKYSNKKIAVLGLGKEGKSTLNFLDTIGCKKITVIDKSLSKENEYNKKYETLGGEKYLDDLNTYDLIFKTPGISYYNEKVYPVRENLISNSEIFFDNYKGKVIGVTATKGKSTTSALIYETLKNAGYRVKLVGNIGNPVLDEVDILTGETYDYIIYELSSYMLETIQPKCFIAILGNLFECHLTWHNNSFETYKKAKLNITKNSQNILIGNDFTNLLIQIESPFLKGTRGILPNSGEERVPWGSTQSVAEGEGLRQQTIYTFGAEGDYSFKDRKFFAQKQEVLEVKNILLQGEHNKKNISSVIGVCDIISKYENNEESSIKLIQGLSKTLEHFEGLAHRIQNIGTYKEITFIDDAIATTPQSTIAAIETFGSQIGTIFLGGEKNNNDYTALRNILEKYNISNIVLFPDSGNDIFKDFSQNLEFEKTILLEGYNNYKPKLYKTTSMKNAVEFAYQNTPSGKICILSNASPSFSLWKSFIEKGELFQKEVKNYR